VKKTTQVCQKARRFTRIQKKSKAEEDKNWEGRGFRVPGKKDWGLLKGRKRCVKKKEKLLKNRPKKEIMSKQRTPSGKKKRAEARHRHLVLQKEMSTKGGGKRKKNRREDAGEADKWAKCKGGLEFKKKSGREKKCLGSTIASQKAGHQTGKRAASEEAR